MPQALRQQEDTAVSLSLQDCYQGPLADFTPPLIGGAPPSGAINASSWHDPAKLEHAVALFANRYPGGDLRAIASLWSKWHFSATAIPTLTAHLLLNRELPVSLDELHVLIDDQGATQRIWLPHEGKTFTTLDTTERFTKLVDQHWVPLIERLSALSGVAPRVFWSNAGGYVDYYVNALAAHPFVDHNALAATRALLSSRTLNGLRNPLFEPLRTYQPNGSEEVKQVRKLCCLRYLLADIDVCGNCPLEGCDRIARGR